MKNFLCMHSAVEKNTIWFPRNSASVSSWVWCETRKFFFFWRLKIPASSLSKILKIATVTYDVWKSPRSDWEETSAHVRAGFCFLVCSGRLHVMAFLESGLTDQTGLFASSRKQLSHESSDVRAYSLAESQLIKWSVGSLLNNRRAAWHQVHNKNKSRCCWQ